MKVLITSDFRVVCSNERIYLASQHYHIIKRYKEVFDDIVLCARVACGSDIINMHDATELLDGFEGCKDLMDSLSYSYRLRLETKIKQCDLVVGRFHGIIPLVASKLAKKHKKPFFAELMGDAWDAYWNHGMTGKMIAPWVFWNTKKVVKNADYALYVTQEFLQNRYPCKNESISASNVLIEVTDGDILKNRLGKIERFDNKFITLMTTAAVDVRYKGQEYVIKAIPKLNKAGIRVRYILVGGGDQMYLKDISKKYGVEAQVEFLGRRPLNEVFELLDTTDIYIQPSLQEGLPRSVIEAMSRACPVIGARTAGIPELIEDRFVVKRKSVTDVIEKIIVFSKMSSEELSNIAKRNFEESHNYEKCVLDARRNEYFEKIKSALKKY